MGEVKPFSNTQLGMYENCGEQYRRRYILGEKMPPGAAQIRGISVHKAVSVNLKQKIDSAVDLPVEQVVQAAADEVERAFHGEVMLTEEQRSLGVRAVKGTVLDQATALTRLHSQKVAPTIQPALVEESVTIPPIAGMETGLIGIIDLADRAGVVEDLKTASRSPKPSDADDSEQLDVYDILYQARTGQRPAAVRLRHLVRTAAGNLSVVTQDSQRTEEQRQAWLERMAVAQAGIKAGTFMPTKRTNWWCDPKWCGYHSTCRYVRR